MSSLVVDGGKRLSGEICVGGSKNAALPLLFSSIVTDGISTFFDIPDITDVRVAVEILKDFGAEIAFLENKLVVDTRFLKYREPSSELVEKIRASTYLLGAMLARFGKTKLYKFGGCNFCARPIDMHLDAIKSFGGIIDGDNIYADKLIGCDIYFEKASVGATINTIIMASRALGVTRIFGYAREPHVLCLVNFLRSAGVKIFCNGGYLEIEGGIDKATKG